LALDIDHLPRPQTIHVTDLVGCGQAALAHLPPEFRDTRCAIQATGSHGLKPGLRLRLWFWLDRPMSGAELKRWLRAAPVDSSIFGAGQIIYTSNPIFLPGALNPCPIRFAMLPGRSEVTVPPLPPPPAPTANRRAMPVVTSGDAFLALTRAAVEVAAAEAGTCHRVLLSAAARLARLVATGALAPDDVRDVLVDAAVRAGKPEVDAERVVVWALTRPPVPSMGAIQE
jgi:hypothetical protein